MVGFVVLVRPQPSVLRATAMGLVAVLALSAGRRRQGLPGLCAAVLGLVLLDPWLARSYGFALSVLATAGILVLAPGWRDRLARRLPDPLATAVAVPMAAQAACAPVIAMLSGQVSLVAIPANLLAAAAVPPATVLGVLATVAAPVAMPVAIGLAWLAGRPARWIIEIAEHGARLPGAAVSWPGGVAGAATLAAVMVVGVFAARRLAGRSGFAAVAVVVMLVVIGLRPVFPGLPPGWPPSGWVLVACDVGQGDALVLSVEAGTAVVVDTGPDPPLVDRCLRDLGVRRVPLVVLTHFHADHVEGLSGVLRGRTIGEVQVSPLDDPPYEADRVRRWAAAAGVPVAIGAVGERRIVGGLSWRLIWPRRLIHGQGSAPNNASLVLYAEHAGIRMLLTGDVEPPAQAALLRAEPQLGADVLKVPHHGSAFQDPDLVRAVHPRAALISVGRDNDYGHPAATTLALMRASGAYVARTDQDGDVAVAGPADRLRVVTRRPHANVAAFRGAAGSPWLSPARIDGRFLPAWDAEVDGQDSYRRSVGAGHPRCRHGGAASRPCGDGGDRRRPGGGLRSRRARSPPRQHPAGDAGGADEPVAVRRAQGDRDPGRARPVRRSHRRAGPVSRGSSRDGGPRDRARGWRQAEGEGAAGCGP